MNQNNKKEAYKSQYLFLTIVMIYVTFIFMVSVTDPTTAYFQHEENINGSIGAAREFTPIPEKRAKFAEQQSDNESVITEDASERSLDNAEMIDDFLDDQVVPAHDDDDETISHSIHSQQDAEFEKVQKNADPNNEQRERTKDNENDIDDVDIEIESSDAALNDD